MRNSPPYLMLPVSPITLIVLLLGAVLAVAYLFRKIRSIFTLSLIETTPARFW